MIWLEARCSLTQYYVQKVVSASTVTGHIAKEHLGIAPLLPSIMMLIQKFCDILEVGQRA